MAKDKKSDKFKKGLSRDRAAAILAATAKEESEEEKEKNPRLKKVKGK